jgi:recombination endonuclease VII
MSLANFETGLKVCSACKVECPIDNFYFCGNKADKLYSHCKDCHRLRNAVNRVKYRDRAKTTRAEYRRVNKEKIRLSSVIYRLKNKEKIQAHRAAYKLKNRDRILAQAADYRRKKPKRHRSDIYRQQVYGLSPEGFQSLKESQQGKCIGCLRDLDSLKKICVDHDHRFPKGDPRSVRGLLCHGCNVSLGHLSDNTETLKRLTLYLEAHTVTTA